MSKAVHVTTATFEDQVILSDQPVIVDFYADWCGPCKMLSPVLEQLAVDHTEVKIAKVNVDEEPALAERYRVRGIPHVVMFRNGKVAEQVLVELGCRGQLAGDTHFARALGAGTVPAQQLEVVGGLVAVRPLNGHQPSRTIGEDVERPLSIAGVRGVRVRRLRRRPARGSNRGLASSAPGATRPAPA